MVGELLANLLILKTSACKLTGQVSSRSRRVEGVLWNLPSRGYPIPRSAYTMGSIWFLDKTNELHRLDERRDCKANRRPSCLHLRNLRSKLRTQSPHNRQHACAAVYPQGSADGACVRLFDLGVVRPRDKRAMLFVGTHVSCPCPSESSTKFVQLPTSSPLGTSSPLERH